MSTETLVSINVPDTMLPLDNNAHTQNGVQINQEQVAYQHPEQTTTQIVALGAFAVVATIAAVGMSYMGRRHHEHRQNSD